MIQLPIDRLVMAEENAESESKEKPGAADDVDFLYEAIYKRDPKKRRVKPVERHLLQLDFGLSDSENDSDFEINEHEEPDSGGSVGEADEGDDISSDGGDYDEDDAGSNGSAVVSDIDNKTSIGELITKARVNSSRGIDKTGSSEKPSAKLKMLICAVCLGEVSIDSDEIVECDSCGIGVHEGCYGEILSDSDSASSVQTASSTEPWFCDTCKAGVTNPTCELCPNSGGIFKETDARRWVHVVCALYVPGVAFADVEKLRWVTLSEMPTGKWGVRTCVYCEDERFSRTGVCISCDAGMCRNYFHVTCGQREGILSEASPEEDIADPFYAYCKLHVEKSSMRYRRQNYLAIQSQLKRFKDHKPDDPIGQERIAEKLKRQQEKYQELKHRKPVPWVPTEKVPRLLTTSPSAVRHLMKKAELLGINTDTPHQAHHIKENTDIRRKWHIPAAFSTEFVGYFLDRDVRMTNLKNRLGDSMRVNEHLKGEQSALRTLYDKLTSEIESLRISTAMQRMEGQSLWKMLVGLGLKKQPMPEAIKSPHAKKLPAKKEGGPKSPAVIHVCGICEQSTDQHQLALCDTCKKHYHLGCLNPPLSRMPKKTAFSGWQCSECVSSSSDTSIAETVEGEEGDEAGRRKRRVIREPNKFTPPVDKGSQKKVVNRRRRRGRRVLKRKLAKEETETAEVEENSPIAEDEPPKAKRERVAQRRLPAKDVKEACCKCSKEGESNLVRCDQCLKCYHFSCLDPPCRKCPKKVGYMWYCTDCDTGSSTEASDNHQDDHKDNQAPPTDTQSATPTKKANRGKVAGEKSPAKRSPGGDKGSPGENEAMGDAISKSPNGNKTSPNRNTPKRGASPRGTKASANGKEGPILNNTGPTENKGSPGSNKTSPGKGVRRASPSACKDDPGGNVKGSPSTKKRTPTRK